MQEQAVIQNQFNDPTLYDEDDDFDAQADKYLLFRISKEIYGIDIKHVKEIIELQKITEVPDMPEYINGVLNLRGKIIPAMDMRLRFHMEERMYDSRTCIIIVNVNNKAIGLVVDTVAEVQDIPLENIEPAPNFKSSNVKERFISGLAKAGEDVQIILDVEKIISQEKLKSVSDESQTEKI